MRRKFTYGLVLLAIIAAVVWVGYKVAYPEYQQWKFNRWAENFNKGLEDYFKNDTYGGKTPQETYSLYIAALQRGDTDAASKYFYWERQVAQKQKLDELKAKGELQKYIADLPKWAELREEEYWDKDGRRYTWEEILKEPVTTQLPDGAGGYIEHTFKPGKYKQEIILQFNKPANIWKIYSL
jgi:hypothetical protein